MAFKHTEPINALNGLDLITVGEAVKKLQNAGATGVSRHLLYKWLNEGELPYILNGNRKLFAYSDLAKVINKKKIGGGR